MIVGMICLTVCEKGVFNRLMGIENVGVKK